MPVAIELPRAVGADQAALTALLARLSFGADSGIALRLADADALGIAGADERSLLSVPLLPANAAAGVEISVGQWVQAPPFDRLVRFLDAQRAVLDHVGINFSQSDLSESMWRDFIAALAARVPAWRLELGSANDIVFVVCERETAPAAVVELVYDRAAAVTHVHLCARVAADRAVVEREFAAPQGGYKPGDEAFFRSVALPSLLRVPAYVDLAFSDAAVAPWPQTVRAIGRRIEV